MDMFYYETPDNLLMPVNHMEARQMIAVKLKERDEKLCQGKEDTVFSIWAGRNVNCAKFTCIEDLDEWVAYLSTKELRTPVRANSRSKMRA